jgi:hypothetical protein
VSSTIGRSAKFAVVDLHDEPGFYLLASIEIYSAANQAKVASSFVAAASIHHDLFDACPGSD